MEGPEQLKWTQTLCLWSFGPQVSTFFFFSSSYLILTNILLLLQVLYYKYPTGRDQKPAPHIVITHISTRTNRVGKGARKGNNREWARDASCLKLCFLFIYTSYYTHKVYQQALWTMMMRAAATSTTITPPHPSHTIPFGNMTNGGGAQDMLCLKPGYVFFMLLRFIQD